MKCPLCRPITKKTKWHYEDERISVFDCDNHYVPMWVWHEHRRKLDGEEIKYGRDRCHELFGENISFRGPRSILGHYHEHVIIGG